jgi:hypothetical protein
MKRFSAAGSGDSFVQRADGGQRSTPPARGATRHPSQVVAVALFQSTKTPLHYAVGQGRNNTARLLLSKAEVNTKDSDGATPLHWAAARGSEMQIELLLANKASPNAKCNKGWTPLQYAVNAGHQNVAKLLRQYGGHE